jgi:hypothetical protein
MPPAAEQARAFGLDPPGGGPPLVARLAAAIVTGA